MNRKLFITIHLYLASFFAPFVLLVAISGGLYLAGVKGTVESNEIYSGVAGIDTKSATLKKDVEGLLTTAGVADYSFEYVKVKGDTLYTRPTSREHYVIKLSQGSATLTHAQPSLQSRMVELHKGHGPMLFKTFQQIFAVGLLFVFLSGVWLGVSSPALRVPTAITAVAGAVVFSLLLL
jgi:hypothetical protein